MAYVDKDNFTPKMNLTWDSKNDFILCIDLASKDKGIEANTTAQMRRHVPPKVSGPPRVFKCCQKDLIFDYSEASCVDPSTKDWFRNIMSTKSVTIHDN